MAPATTTTVSYTPSYILCKHQYYLKNTSFSADSFSASKSFCSEKTHTQWVSKSMNKSTRVSAFRDVRESNKNVQVFEQETFMDDGFRVKFLFREMEYMLNRLVSTSSILLY